MSLILPQRIRNVAPKRKREGLLDLARLLQSGQVRPVIGRTYQLSETPSALADFASGHARGKLVIAV